MRETVVSHSFHSWRGCFRGLEIRKGPPRWWAFALLSTILGHAPSSSWLTGSKQLPAASALLLASATAARPLRVRVLASGVCFTSPLSTRPTTRRPTVAFEAPTATAKSVKLALGFASIATSKVASSGKRRTTFDDDAFRRLIFCARAHDRKPERPALGVLQIRRDGIDLENLGSKSISQRVKVNSPIDESVNNS